MIIKYFCDYCGHFSENEEEVYEHEKECKLKAEKVKKLEDELLDLLNVEIKFRGDKLFYHEMLKEEQINKWLTETRLNKDISLIGSSFFESEGFKKLTELRKTISEKNKEILERSPYLEDLEVRDYLARQYFEEGIKYV